MILILILIIYALSVTLAYKFMQLAHYNSKGRWKSLNLQKLNFKDWFFVWCPLFNFYPAIDYLLGNWKIK